MSEAEDAVVPAAVADDLPRVARRRVVMADVAALQEFTARSRALDYRHGGGRCVDVAVARLPFALGLLSLPADDRVATPLHTAVADLHNLAGWACFDVGATGAAMRHFRTALALAADNGDEALVSNIHYRLGRVHLHHDAPTSAMAEFRLGERAARASGSALAEAVVGANQAWAHAKMGQVGEAVTRLPEVEDSFARAEGRVAPGWAAFFTTAEVAAITGLVHTELARTTHPRHAALAVPLLTEAMDSYGEDMARSKAFSLISLAVCHLLDGQLDAGVRLGSEAVDQCGQLDSTRTTARLRPLHDAAADLSAHRGAGALAERIREFRPVRADIGR